MPYFFFPTWRLIPEKKKVVVGDFALVSKAFKVLDEDLAYLQASINHHYYQFFVDGSFDSCCEIAVIADDHASAYDRVQQLRVGLCLEGVRGFGLPVESNASFNEYGGIARRGNLLRPPVLPGTDHVTADSIKFWQQEAVLQIFGAGTVNVSERAFKRAVENANSWQKLLERHHALTQLHYAVNFACIIQDPAQSLLLIWTALESLFPEIQSEVTYRLSFALAVLCKPVEPDVAMMRQRLKKAYNVRSRIAHGELRNFKPDNWVEAWNIMILVVKALLAHGTLPTEDQLVDGLLVATDSED